jgi:hypothetical protein
MYVVCHHNVSVKSVMLQRGFLMVNRFHDHSGDFWFPQIQRAGAPFVQDSVHGYEVLT